MIPAHILLKAYITGIFPMAEGRNGKVNWYEADPRGILDIYEFHCPKRLVRTYQSGKFVVKINSKFRETIEGCAQAPRDGTWISEEIIESYMNLHKLGYAHSVESYLQNSDDLAGGLYGVAIGGAFFGESMFYRITDASKIALVALIEHLREKKYQLLDMQMLTEHMRQFGGKLISKREYHILLQKALEQDCKFI
ncbi:MAG: leucyl/phenylalanyl-tRNA--protein transferase [Candidatus Thorarchaeota archaeon]